MNFREIINFYWKEIFPDKVISLSMYRFERNKKYPRVGTRIFSNWVEHKLWMNEELKKHLRKLHNDGVLSRLKQQQGNPSA